MESLNLPVFIKCPIHASEVIQRIDLNVFTRKQIYCLQCALENDNPKSLLESLETLPNFLNLAVNFYSKNKTSLKTCSGPPPQYLKELAKQNETFEKLVEHMKQEKEKIESIFKDILSTVVEVVNEKKRQLIDKIDRQQFSLSQQYNALTKQLMKAYPRTEDLTFLFPTKEQLESSMAKLKTAVELENFVRNIKEDLNQGKLTQNFAELDEGAKTKYFDTFLVKLKEQENIKPTADLANIDIKKIQVTMRVTLERLFDKEFGINYPIPEGLFAQGYLESTIVRPENFGLLKEWIPSKYKFALKLLYRSSRDGANPQAFHALCDGKGPTLTLIKCQFDRSSKTSIIGGFLDKDWHHLGDYIPSDEAFMFSITAGIKCPISNRLFAAYGGPRNGPRFGNCDLQVYASRENHFDQTLIRPGTFSFTAKLIESDRYSGSGEINFKLEEMEVYQVR